MFQTCASAARSFPRRYHQEGWTPILPVVAPLSSPGAWTLPIDGLSAADLPDGNDHGPTLAAIVDLLPRGVEAAVDEGKTLPHGQVRAIWRRALAVGPAASLDLTLEMHVRRVRLSIDGRQATHWDLSMIMSFKHRGLKSLYDDRTARRVAPEHARKLLDILAVLDRSSGPNDLDLPGLRLHPLKGGLKGRYAVSVSGDWRVTFRFEDGQAVDVDYVDYH